MYYRSPESRRTPSPLPLHYGGNAFRSDGTPTEIPVRRISELPLKTEEDECIVREDALQSEQANRRPREGSPEKSKACDSIEEKAEGSKRSPPFLSRLLGGILPSVKEDDLLLLFLLLLLSREEGNEEVLLLLAVLLFSS